MHITNPQGNDKASDAVVALTIRAEAAEAKVEQLRDALGLLRGYVPMYSEGWDIINDALKLS